MKVLVTLDSAASAESITRDVLAQPWPQDTSFDILHVHEKDPESTELSEALDQAVRSLTQCGYSATSHIFEGSPGAVILDAARLLKSNLIVLQARRRLGGTISQVLRNAKCSVQILRQKTGATHPCRVVLATDGSTESMKAAESLAARPWQAGTNALVVSVVELLEPPVVSLVGPDEPGFPTFAGDYRAARDSAQDSATRAGATIRGSCAQVQESIQVVTTDPAPAILAEAQRFNAGYIFVGAHDIRGIDRMLLGSVSHDVAVHAAATVEVVR